MTERILGTTGIEIPRVILGCGTFGGIGGAPDLVGHGLKDVAAFETLDEAFSIGITMFDTAERYAEGKSEQVIGEWLRQQPIGVTSEVRIATKVAAPFADGLDNTPFNRSYIEKNLKPASLDWGWSV